MAVVFMYLDALKALEHNDEYAFQLKKHTDELSNIYEYWNEMLNLSDLGKIRRHLLKHVVMAK